METLVFEPGYGGLTGTLAFSLAGVLLGGVGLWIGVRKEWKRKDRKAYKPIVALLSFILALLSVGTIVFTLLAREKLVDVVISQDSITTQYGTVGIQAIKNAFIENEIQPSFFNPVARDTIHLLIIEEMTGKAHVLSSENYDVDGIMRGLKQRIR